MILPSSTDVLNTMLPHHPAIDGFRVLVAFIGVVHLLFAVDRFLKHQVLWTGIAFMATGLLTTLQQMEAIGEEFVPWRLPLYALMNIAGIIFLYRLGPDGNERTCYCKDQP